MNMEMQVERKESKSSIAPKGKVAVIGSGLVGKSWAIVFARAGYEVNLFDAIPGFAEKSLPAIEAIATELHKFGLLRVARSASDVMKLIHPVDDLKAALSGVQWVQECTPENVESKRKVFQELDAIAASGVIVASSSSAIPPSAFIGDCASKHRCLVVHPVNPPHLIPLVEIVPAPSTDSDVVTRSRAFMEEVGQKPIVVKKEIDSFILNRLQGAVLNEAFKLVQEGYISPQDLDTTMKDGLGLRWSFMGPFETIDLNAPGGVKDYIERYSPSMYSLAQQQAVAKKWEGNVVDEVVDARRGIMPVDDLPKRSQWRDHRLMELISQKNRLDAAESKGAQ